MTYDELCAMAARAAEFKIPHFLVPRSRQMAAAWGAKRATELLGLRRVPRVTFFRPTRETGPVHGAASVGDGEILVRCDLSLAATADIAAHETLHADGDPDEVRAADIQRKVRGEWLAERFAIREQLTRDLKTLFSRINNGNVDSWGGTASLTRLSQWYGGMKGVGLADLDVLLDELEELDAIAPVSLTAHLRLAQTAPLRAQYSYERVL